MRTATVDRQFNCPVEATLSIVGGKWKAIILFHLLGGQKRFGTLQRLVPGITQRILTLQLRELEQDAIITRTVYAEVPPRVEYALTSLGKSLQPLLSAMRGWGENYVRRLNEGAPVCKVPIPSLDAETGAS